MVAYIYCKDCKHYYAFFKEIKNKNGTIDFTTIPKCRLGYKITSKDMEANPECFEPRR